MIAILLNSQYAKVIVGVLVFLIALCGLGYLIFAILHGSNLSLTTLALMGILALLGSLLVFTTVLHAVGLSNDQQALGLPDGSVRALLALALLGLFAILAAAVLAGPSPHTLQGLTAEQVAEFVKTNPEHLDVTTVQLANQPTTYTVRVYPPAEYDDFSKQILTLVGTLMTAVISFYFGSSSPPGSGTQTQAGGTAQQPPSPTGMTPPATPAAATDQIYAIAGTGLDTVARVEFVPAAGAPVAATIISTTATALSARVNLPAAGTWSVRVATATGSPIAVPGGTVTI